MRALAAGCQRDQGAPLTLVDAQGDRGGDEAREPDEQQQPVSLGPSRDRHHDADLQHCCRSERAAQGLGAGEPEQRDEQGGVTERPHVGNPLHDRERRDRREHRPRVSTPQEQRKRQHEAGDGAGPAKRRVGGHRHESDHDADRADRCDERDVRQPRACRHASRLIRTTAPAATASAA
jgi:hypothetical protein